MPTFRLSPNADTYWVAAGERLEIPDSVIGAPALANENDLTTGIQVNATDIVFGIAGVAHLSVGSTISVAGIADYETLVVADDDVPNKKYVDDAIVAAAPHTHTEADITDLQAYSLTTHDHDVDYADIVHNHDAAYAALLHNHDADYAALAHTHVEADITDLQAYALDADVVKLTGDQTVAGTKTLSAPLVLASYAIASLPTGTVGAMVYVTDDVGGPVPAFYDGAAWRRVTDRAVCSTV